MPRRRRYDLAKRAFDVTVAVAALPVLLLVLLICAIAIKLDSPGPVMFHQPRTGRNGRRFGMFKLRTMVRNAEQLKAELAHLNVLPAPDFKIPDDPRVTRVGKILRKTSLDEAPQLLNVLRGDMSIVGPRPTSFAPSTYELWHTQRLEVRPGITGLWQVEGRGSTTFDERLRLDVRYIRNQSLLQDLLLVLRTFGSVVRRPGT